MASKPPKSPPRTPTTAKTAKVPKSFGNLNCTPQRRNMITNCWWKLDVNLLVNFVPSSGGASQPLALIRSSQSWNNPSGTANSWSMFAPVYLSLSPDTTSIIQSATFSPSGYRKPMDSRYGLMPTVSPQYTDLPPLPSKSRCVKAEKTAKRGWWMTHTTVMPAVPSLLMHRASCSAAAPSKPDVGSSMNKIRGAAVSSKPMLTRFF
mmetsp:Transcript_102800/g.257906  ORF Transcript_102800/g.257906 Transcript_102800/m.257906 type:complete len:206 (-) Transcript_102800:1098-1715(-)